MLYVSGKKHRQHFSTVNLLKKTVPAIACLPQSGRKSARKDAKVSQHCSAREPDSYRRADFKLSCSNYKGIDFKIYLILIKYTIALKETLEILFNPSVFS